MSPARMSSATKRNPYSVHPSVAMVQKWVEERTGKTGRPLEQWVALTKDSGPPTEKERREWLKKEHKLGINSGQVARHHTNPSFSRSIPAPDA